MNNKMYKKIARLIVNSGDPGGELVKLMAAIDELDPKMILNTQAVTTEGNPIVHITLFTNKQTDFPLETEELYRKWVIDYAEELKRSEEER